MKKIILITMALFSINSFSAEKNRGYCGRIVNSSEVDGAALKYGDHSFKNDPVYLIAIQCYSEKISKDLSVKDLTEDSEIAFAVIWEPGINNLELEGFAENKSNVCVRARWASPGPCNGGSRHDWIFTSTDSFHSINYLSQEDFSKEYYPYGKIIR